jgi:NAD-dependent SIR2 family protein deacetylase
LVKYALNSIAFNGDKQRTLVNYSASTELKIQRVADLILEADSLIITAGAGMGVDSGLPDFRGKDGFWKAYPALAKDNISFSSIACPETFVRNPTLAWGFYGHRLNLYRQVSPHNGFKLLLNIAERLDGDAFVYTSNVDGQFQKAGFHQNNIIECHGSIHHLQCQNGCNQSIWEATSFTPQIDEGNCLLTSSAPTCPVCREIARPNVYMFGDWDWLERRTNLQYQHFTEWRSTVVNPVVIEIGAGLTIPTVRRFGESLKTPLIRINLQDADVHRAEDISLRMGALEGIKAISDRLTQMGFMKDGK